MVQKRAVELGVGLFVAAGIAALLMLALKVSNMSNFSSADGYNVTARFENIGGLKVRSPVTVSGVRVGRVAAIELDDKDYDAVVYLHIDSNYNKLPTDSTASILTSGVLGENYIGLEAGADETFLKEGGEVKLTQSAMVLEQLNGKFLFNKAAGDGDEEK